MTTRTREEVSTETVAEQRRARPGKRVFDDKQGRLGFIQKLTLPGFKLHLANDKDPNDPFAIQRLLAPEVGYEYVHPSEVGLTEILGISLTDKVTVPVGNGIMGVLLKQPIEYAEEDFKERMKMNKKGVFDYIDKNMKDVEKHSSLKDEPGQLPKLSKIGRG